MIRTYGQPKQQSAMAKTGQRQRRIWIGDIKDSIIEKLRDMIKKIGAVEEGQDDRHD